MSKDSFSKAPIGFWRFVIVATVGLTIVQKFLMRDPEFQFLKGVPVFAVAIVLWGAYRYFFNPIRFAELGSTSVASGQRAKVPETFSSEPSPREARVTKVLTAEDLRRLHSPKINKKTKQKNKMTERAYQISISSEKSGGVFDEKPAANRLASSGRITIRKKAIREKTVRQKSVRTKRAPFRLDPKHL